MTTQLRKPAGAPASSGGQFDFRARSGSERALRPAMIGEIPNTPKDVEGELARLGMLQALVQAKMRQAADQIGRADRLVNPMFMTDGRRAELMRLLNEGQLESEHLEEKMHPLYAEYAVQGGWSRFFLVDNTGGHVHSSRQCSTCFDSTQYYWLTEYSGFSDAELVEVAGEEACTVCFPDAPVDVLRRKSSISTPDRVAREATRVEREGKRAAATAKKEANAITNVDGSRIEFGKWDRIETVHATKTMFKDSLTDLAVYKPGELPNPQYLIEREEKVSVLKEALRNKLGEEEFAEYLAKTEKKVASDAKKILENRAQWLRDNPEYA